MNTNPKILVLAIVILILEVVLDFARVELAADNVTVRVFQSHATGGLVYCRTGSLPASSHEDIGTASVSVSQAVDCP